MPIRCLKFELSPDLRQELEIVDKQFRGRSIDDLFSPLQRPEDFYGGDRWRRTLLDIDSLLPESGPRYKILDIGVGTGRSSIYLAAHGHQVAALEPSAEQCRLIDAVSTRLKLPITVYQGIAEEAQQINESDFDLCLFNSSLHHCDDPLRALQHCKQILKPGGRVFLLSEPILKPFRSKRWYFRRLKENPQAMGHYGGNEHVYYNWEYQRLLRRAGFMSVRQQSVAALKDLRTSVLMLATARTPLGYVYSNTKLVQHLAWNALMSRAVGISSLEQCLARLSLIPVNFQAENPQASR